MMTFPQLVSRVEGLSNTNRRTTTWGKHVLKLFRDRDYPLPDYIQERAPNNDDLYPTGFRPKGHAILFEWYLGDEDCPYISLELDPYGIVTILTDPADGDGPCGTDDNMTVLQHRTTAAEETADFFRHCIDQHFNL